MSYVRQGTLFSFEDFVAGFDDNERLVLTLSELPDERLQRYLELERKPAHGPDPCLVMWRCLIAKFVYQIRCYSELIRELKRNGSLRRLVGIERIEEVPAAWDFSRFLRKLSSPQGLALLAEMFEQLVAQLTAALPGMGQHLAVDATAVRAYSNELRREKSDGDARWSARPKRQRRRPAGSGQVEEYLDYWFGYQVHLIVDCQTELPVACEVTAANENETTHFEPMLQRLQRHHEPLVRRTEAIMADAGYDSSDNCRYVLSELQALPVIKMRLTQKRQDRDQPFAGATSLCNELGTQLCDSGHKMVYAGRDRDYLKWRCPVACGKAQRCTAFGRCSASAYGTVRKISIWEDPRRFPGLARESKKWTRLYRKRTAAERVNARLKDWLLLDELTLRGMAKVTMHASVSLLVMLAGAQAMVTADQLERVRQVVRLAA